MSFKRWRVVANYRSEVGDVDVEHSIAELYELQELMERGPNFYAIKSIVITVDHSLVPAMTLEQAAED